MKTYLFIFLTLSITFFSCEKDDDNPVNGNNSGNNNGSKQQNGPDKAVSGKIEGRTFEFIQGNALKNWDNGKTLITLYPVAFEDSCSQVSDVDEVFFAISPVVGKQKLNLDWSDWEKSLTVTLLHHENFMNYIAVDGYIELTEIDTIQGVIKGNLEANYDQSSYAKGSFTVHICDEISYF